jgi:hypothetical protein
MAFEDYSATPSLNTTIAGQNIAPGGPPSAVGPGIRQLMADGKASTLFLRSEVGAQSRPGEAKIAEQRSVLDFIPANLHAGIVARTYTGDLSTYVQKAMDTLGRVFFPNGTYFFNVVAGATFHLYGEAARLTIVKPYNVALPVVRVYADQFWSYSRSFTDLQFQGVSRTGIGVALGCLGPADYSFTPGDQYAQSVTFTRCRLYDFEKGVVAGAGNLGIEFYATNFHGCYYGAYFLNQKNISGGVMHAGCKYFFGGEFDYNVVGVYVHNSASDFGGVSFHGTIIEANGIDVYCFSTNTRQPVTFVDVWTENASDTGLGANITVDTWTGATVGTMSIPTADFVFDGADSSYVFKAGFVSGVHVRGTNILVDVDGSGVETKIAFNGAPFIVTDPTTSRVKMRAIRCVGGVDPAEGVVVEDYAVSGNYTITGSNADRKQFPTTPRFNKQTALGGDGVTKTFETAGNATLVIGSGPATPVAGTVVADGQIYAACSQFVLPFTAAGQFYSLPSTLLSAQVVGEWYVATLDVKKTGGTPIFYIGDLGSNQLMASCAPAGSNWNTLAAIGQATATGGMSLQVSTTTAATATIRVSAYQIRGFPTRTAAEAYLRACIYAA